MSSRAAGAVLAVAQPLLVARRQTMLRLISSQQSDHPLDSRRARRALGDDFAKMAPLAILSEISGYLDAIKTADNLKPARALEIIDFLDIAGAPVQRGLTQEYIAAGPRVTKFHQGRIRTTVHSYWSQLAESYRFCLASYQVGAVGASALKAQLAKTICRAMRACSVQTKWALLRPGPVDPKLWREVAELYRLGEALGLTTVATTVYPNSASSVEREFCRALMLSVSAADALAPAQVQLVEDIVAQLSEDFRLSERPAPGAYYVVDLSGQTPPGRFSAGRNAGEQLRCFGPGAAAVKIDDMIRYLDEHNALPPDLEITLLLDVSALRITLRHLSRYWAQVPPERKQPRQRHTERITVVHDYEEVLAGVGGLFLESPFVSNEEQWEVENVSETGFGAFVPAPYGSWLRLGSLIGLRREEGASWGAGVVRRITFDEKENRYIGIQMLAAGGSAVTIRSAALSAKGSAISALGELAVLVGAGVSNSSEVTLRCAQICSLPLTIC